MKHALRYALIVVLTILFGIPATLAAFVDRSGETSMRVGRGWVRTVLRLCGIRLRVEGLDHVDPRQPYVFMSNHQSVFDIAALIATAPVPIRFVAKRELAWIPLFGWALALSGHVLIDRSDRTQAIHSLERAAGRVRGGTSVIVFPEGTRSPDGTLRGFKKGGFHLALAAQVPVLPVTVSGSQRIAPKRSLRVESGEIKIVYGRPIPTAGMTRQDRESLVKQVREAIESGYDPAYQGTAYPGATA